MSHHHHHSKKHANSPRQRRRLEDSIEAFMEDHDPEEGAGETDLVQEHLDDHHDDDDDIGESTGLEPLVAHQHHRRPPLEIVSSSSWRKDHKAETEAEQVTCFGDTWRLVASVLLAAVMVIPMIQYSRNYYKESAWPSDLLQCANSSNYDIQFSKLYRVVSRHPKQWCHANDKENCHCHSPVLPHARVPETPHYWSQWDETFQRNQELAAAASADPSDNNNLDVVLVGDSITEHWLGTSMGMARPKLQDVSLVFQKLFTKQGGGDIDGLALGIAGDRCPQLLYRLQNGEMPDNLNPKVWWLLIGTNDLGGDGCSPQAILVGIIRIVQEIRQQRPNAWIVVNGILPRPSSPTGVLAGKYWTDIVWINERMECFVAGEERVDYYNATDIFLNQDKTQVVQELMPDWLHPSALGCQAWGEGIVQKVKELVVARDDDDEVP